jgi:hypothetical protein
METKNIKRFKLVSGNEKVIEILVNDGWEIINTFPNPYPEPYFYALMCLKIPTSSLANAQEYNFENVEDHVYRGEKLNQWKYPTHGN